MNVSIRGCKTTEQSTLWKSNGCSYKVHTPKGVCKIIVSLLGAIVKIEKMATAITLDLDNE